jgi:serine/threonine protein kinase
MNTEQLCMGCMGDRAGAQVCPLCGWEEGTPPELPVQLTARTLISEKYLLGRVLGQGGFGITYLAWDLLLNRKLAIKEYFPREICGRGRDSLTLQPLSQKSQHDYQYGLSKFVEEGRNLARFRDYPGIVSLLDFFEGNGTAYIVMAYMEGMTFKQYLEEQGGKITFDQALAILNPVMDALREVHRIGMLHRDISPDNVYLNRDRQVKILDFGATRYAMREQSQNLTVMIKPGYAPLEQYSSGGKQGPWSDVYATAATFYRALTGRAPSEAPDRLAQDDLVAPSRMSIAIPQASETALLKALAVHHQNRFQNMEDFQKAIIPKSSEPGAVGDPNREKPMNPVLLALAIVLLLTTLASAAMWLSARGQLKTKDSEIANLNLQLAGTRGGADSTKQRSDLNAEKSQLQDKLQASIASLAVTENERDALAKQVASLTQQLNARASQHGNQTKQAATPPPPRLSLAYFQVYSSDDGVNRAAGPLRPVASSALRYVLCQLGGPNPMHANQDLSTGIEVRFFAPGGSLRRVVTQDVTATRNQVLWTSQAAWGNSQPGTFQSGLWRIEVWSGSDKLGEKAFQVN